MCIRDRVDTALLDVQDGVEGALTAYDAILAKGTPVFHPTFNIALSLIHIYGMGDGAQKILDVCSLKNVKISGFMASDDFVRGHSFAGFEVKKLSDIERQFGDCLIPVSYTHI